MTGSKPGRRARNPDHTSRLHKGDDFFRSMTWKIKAKGDPKKDLGTLDNPEEDWEANWLKREVWVESNSGAVCWPMLDVVEDEAGDEREPQS